eukprot:2975572-Amphidinium_carterae.1
MQAAVDRGTVTAADHHGNGQADVWPTKELLLTARGFCEQGLVLLEVSGSATSGETRQRASCQVTGRGSY